MSQVHFLDLFLGYEPPEAIRAEVETLAVEHAGIDREARTISLRLSSGVYITEALLSQMASELKARYGLRRLELSVQYPPEALASFDYRDLYRVFVKAYSPSAAILAGAGYALEGDTLTIHLRANGKNELLPHVPMASCSSVSAYIRPSPSRRTAIWRERRSLRRPSASAGKP